MPSLPASLWLGGVQPPPLAIVERGRVIREDSASGVNTQESSMRFRRLVLFCALSVFVQPDVDHLHRTD